MRSSRHPIIILEIAKCFKFGKRQSWRRPPCRYGIGCDLKLKLLLCNPYVRGVSRFDEERLRLFCFVRTAAAVVLLWYLVENSNKALCDMYRKNISHAGSKWNTETPWVSSDVDIILSRSNYTSLHTVRSAPLHALRLRIIIGCIFLPMVLSALGSLFQQLSSPPRYVSLLQTTPPWVCNMKRPKHTYIPGVSILLKSAGLTNCVLVEFYAFIQVPGM